MATARKLNPREVCMPFRLNYALPFKMSLSKECLSTS
jgi:hypothetical protein